MSSNGQANGDGHEHVNGMLLADRMPPANIEAEEGVLGSVLLDNSVLDGPNMTRLASEHFFRSQHQVVWRAMRVMRGRAEPIDVLLLGDELERTGKLAAAGGREFLWALVERVPHAANAEYYAGVVLGKASMRGLVDLGNDMLHAGYDKLKSPAETIARFADRFQSIELLPDEDEEVDVTRPWPEPLGPAAYHGVAGELVRLIAPHSETDPAAILGQLLVAFGNMIGRVAHWQIERTKHYGNLYLCVVGASSKARKGMSWDHILNVMRSCDPDWVNGRILSGLASGEGLIWNVRDAITQRVKKKDATDKTVESWQDVIVDPGQEDKRALWVEPEFGSILGIMNRDGNSLSGKVREAFDHGNLRSSPKNGALRATNAHTSIIGHVTNEELRLRLTRNDAANGFGNRFYWLCARRQRLLPHGGKFCPEDFAEVYQKLLHAADNARIGFYLRPIERDDQAKELWEHVYASLSTPKPGLLGAITSRAEALTMRAAFQYAMLDRSRMIELAHLEAGLAFWRYCEQSASYIFGDLMGDPDAEKVLKAITAAGDAGLTATQVRRDVFKGHKTGAQVAAILGVLSRGGMVEATKPETAPGPGRIAVTWKAAGR